MAGHVRRPSPDRPANAVTFSPHARRSWGRRSRRVGHPEQRRILAGQAGDAAGAVAQFDTLVQDTTTALGPDHPNTLTARGNLALWRGHAGDPAGAAAAFEELLRDEELVLGPGHPQTLITRNNVAVWRLDAGDIRGAAQAFDSLVRDQERLLGPDHPDTLTLPEQPGPAVGPDREPRRGDDGVRETAVGSDPGPRAGASSNISDPRQSGVLAGKGGRSHRSGRRVRSATSVSTSGSSARTTLGLRPLGTISPSGRGTRVTRPPQPPHSPNWFRTPSGLLLGASGDGSCTGNSPVGGGPPTRHVERTVAPARCEGSMGELEAVDGGDPRPAVEISARVPSELSARSWGKRPWPW